MEEWFFFSGLNSKSNQILLDEREVYSVKMVGRCDRRSLTDDAVLVCYDVSLWNVKRDRHPEILVSFCNYMAQPGFMKRLGTITQLRLLCLCYLHATLIHKPAVSCCGIEPLIYFSRKNISVKSKGNIVRYMAKNTKTHAKNIFHSILHSTAAFFWNRMRFNTARVLGSRMEIWNSWTNSYHHIQIYI